MTDPVADPVTGQVASRTTPPVTGEVAGQVTGEVAGQVEAQEAQAQAQANEVLATFRNSYHPRIAVTVDMIATGTDIKPLEIVFFMRSVASKNFFEQMKGRGVRVVSDTEMEQVNPGVKRKTRYLIVDAVGVTERVQTESRPLEKKPTVSFEKLLDAAALGTTEVAAVESLAGRLIRLERRFDAEVEAEVVKTAKGQTLSHIAKGLLDAIDPDAILAHAKQGKPEYYEPTTAEIRANLQRATRLRQSILQKAFTGELTETGG